MGSFDVRGEAVLTDQARGHLPIGVVFDAVLLRPAEAGRFLTWDDVELPETLATSIARRLFAGGAGARWSLCARSFRRGHSRLRHPGQTTGARCK
jgi:hypothetical protein